MTLSFVLIALILILLNAFFVAAEFAMVKARKSRIQGQNHTSARAAIEMIEHVEEYLSVTQLGMTAATVALGWIGNLLVPAHHFKAFIVFLMITMFLSVFGELIPKRATIDRAETILLIVARPMFYFHKFARPVIVFFDFLATVSINFIGRLLGLQKQRDVPLTEQELKLLLLESKTGGVISESEAQIINRAFEFSDKRASDIMVPASQVEIISLSRPLEENIRLIKTHMRTRFPLCQTDFSTAFAVVHMKDAWPLFLTHLTNDAFVKCGRPALIVEPELPQDRLMKIFQSRQAHLAIVRNPSSGVNLGIVTMEDVLVSIFGDISDEHGN